MPPPELLLITIFAAVGFLVQALSYTLKRQQREFERAAFWTGAAQDAGLSAIKVRGEALEASAGGLQLRLSPFRSRGAERTRAEIWGPRLAPGLTLRSEAERFGRRSRREVEIGDSDFDQQVSVQGSPALALALLDPGARHAVAALVRGDLYRLGQPRLAAVGRVVDGSLQIELYESPPEMLPPSGGQQPPTHLDRRTRLSMALRVAVELASRLLAPPETAERLAANLTAEPDAGVRRKLLAMLLREFPEAPVTEAAVRAAKNDTDAEVRVRAAIALGKDGRDVLLALARGDGAEDAMNARAVAALDTSLTLAEVQALLTSALRARRLLTARACVGILGRLGGGEAVGSLAQVLLVEKGELGQATVNALALSGEPAAEAPLLRALVEGAPSSSTPRRRRSGAWAREKPSSRCEPRRPTPSFAPPRARRSPRSTRGFRAPGKGSSRSPRTRADGCRSRRARWDDSASPTSRQRPEGEPAGSGLELTQTPQFKT